MDCLPSSITNIRRKIIVTSIGKYLLPSDSSVVSLFTVQMTVKNVIKVSLASTKTSIDKDVKQI